MGKKAIVFDIDGTAVDSPRQKLPTRRLVEQIARLSNKYYFCAATGRVWSFAKPVLKALGLKDPSIISAGTQICEPRTGKIIWQKNIDDDVLREVIYVLKDYPDWRLWPNDGTEKDYFEGGMYPNDFKIAEPVYLLNQVFVPAETAKEIYQKLSTISEIAVITAVSQKPGTDARDIHITNASATKEYAIQKLLQLLGVDKKDTIGIGDGYNDLHLFNAVNRKVAVSNAVPELKQIADEIIGSVNKDGMVFYLQNLSD